MLREIYHPICAASSELGMCDSDTVEMNKLLNFPSRPAITILEAASIHVGILQVSSREQIELATWCHRPTPIDKALVPVATILCPRRNLLHCGLKLRSCRH